MRQLTIVSCRIDIFYFVGVKTLSGINSKQISLYGYIFQPHGNEIIIKCVLLAMPKLLTLEKAQTSFCFLLA